MEETAGGGGPISGRYGNLAGAAGAALYGETGIGAKLCPETSRQRGTDRGLGLFAVAGSPAPDRSRRADLLTALDQLSPEHRAMIALVCVCELTYTEAAKILSLPVGTVMRRLARVRLALHDAVVRQTEQVSGPSRPRRWSVRLRSSHWVRIPPFSSSRPAARPRSSRPAFIVWLLCRLFRRPHRTASGLVPRCRLRHNAHPKRMELSPSELPSMRA
jgi:Sigma-70, region 4